MNTATATKYRWVCRTHREHGRWLTDPGAAAHYAAQHADRRSPSWSQSYGCVPRIEDNVGRDRGAAV